MRVNREAMYSVREAWQAIGNIRLKTIYEALWKGRVPGAVQFIDGTWVIPGAWVASEKKRRARPAGDATSPDYYRRWKIEPLEFISGNNLDFLRGNIIKYIMRYDRKGAPLEDLRKARAYLDALIAKQEVRHA